MIPEMTMNLVCNLNFLKGRGARERSVYSLFISDAEIEILSFTSWDNYFKKLCVSSKLMIRENCHHSSTKWSVQKESQGVNRKSYYNAIWSFKEAGTGDLWPWQPVSFNSRLYKIAVKLLLISFFLCNND